MSFLSFWEAILCFFIRLKNSSLTSSDAKIIPLLAKLSAKAEVEAIAVEAAWIEELKACMGGWEGKVLLEDG